MSFDRAAETYGRVGPDFFSHFGRRLVDLVDVQQQTRVLDAATGVGASLLPASERVGEHGQAVGVELAAPMDYLFLPSAWTVSDVEVGSYEAYVEPRLSDHVPIVVTVDS
jgi:hypothetical protein